MTMIFWFLFFIPCILLWIYYKTYSREKQSNMKGITFIESLLKIRIGKVEVMVNCANEKGIYKGFMYFWLANRFTCLAVDPEAVKLVLKCPQVHKVGLSLSNVSSRYRKLFMKNVLEVDGDDWRRFRNILNHGFSNESIAFFYPLITDCTDQAITKFKENKDTEIWDFISRFTLDLLGKTIFNYDFHRLDGENDQLYRSYKTILSFSITRTGMANMLFPFIEMLPFEGIRNFNKAADFFVKFFSDVIDEMKKKIR